MAEVFFWSSFLIIFWAYFGYPIQLMLQAKFYPKPLVLGDGEPRTSGVSVVIAARNEAKTISRRIENLLAQEYPSELLEIIVVSDGSEDETEDLVREFEAKGQSTIRLISCPVSQGKPNALNLGVASAGSDFIVFADCRQTFKLDAIANLIANFADPTVGCVSGELVFLETPDSSIQTEMGAYWKYEKLVRKSESLSGSVVGATGAIYAIRKELYQPLPTETLLDDVLTPLNIAFKGQRVVFDSSAVAYDLVSKDASQEWRRKVRTLAGNWQLLNLRQGLLNPITNPLWSRFAAHKLLRLLVPFTLPILLISSAMLDGPLFKSFAFIQILFYSLAAIGFFLKPMRQFRLVNLSYFFVVLNGAALAGFSRWVSGNCSTVWQRGPSPGQ